MALEALDGPKVVFSILGFPVTESIISSWIVMGVILVAAYVVARRLDLVPSKVQAVAELYVKLIEGLLETAAGKNGKRILTYIGAVAIYIFMANISSLFGLSSPTADVNVTASLALMTFFLTQYWGIRSKGFGYIKGFFEPVVFLAPLNIIGELARPVSLAFRLFGNILGGSIIVGLIVNAAPYIVPVPLHAYFDLFASLIQTAIFVMLSTTFIGMAMG